MLYIMKFYEGTSEQIEKRSNGQASHAHMFQYMKYLKGSSTKNEMLINVNCIAGIFVISLTHDRSERSNPPFD